jgi:hypothetical protein
MNDLAHTLNRTRTVRRQRLVIYQDKNAIAQLNLLNVFIITHGLGNG